MDEREINPKQNSNFLSKITFWYNIPLFITGYRRDLEEKDLYKVLPEYESRHLGDKIEDEWNKVKFKKNNAMLWVFWNISGKRYFLLGLTRIISIILNVIRPVVIGKLVSFFVPGQTDLTKTDAYLFAFLLIGLNMTDAFYRQNYFMMAESLAIKTRSAFTTLIYRKCLKLSGEHLRNAPTGKIVNLITRDLNYLDLFFFIVNESWTGLISTLINFYQLYQKIGYAIFVLIVAFAIIVPCLILFGSRTASLKMVTSQKTDERIDVLQEVLGGISSAKMNVWEKFVEEKISDARRNEMNILFKMCINMFVIIVTSNVIHHVTFYLVLMTCVWMGQTLTAEIMYFVTGGFQSFSFTLISAFPYSIFAFSQTLVALRRFENIIIKLEEKAHKTNKEKLKCFDGTSIKAEDAMIELNGKIILKNLSFDINKGLNVILGPVSSGKSVLLLTILKYFKVTKGNLFVNGRISYVSQEPWFFPSTIKQNIIFGETYSEELYQEVIRVCALEYDLSLLENGDSTIIAEQGVNLSKGQQGRICLARAIYRESDIYLLDDCLSNLDPLVADSVFNNCIMNFLKNKLVILVTNNSNLLSYADNVMKLHNGEIEFFKNKSPKVIEKSPHTNFVLNNEFSHSHQDEEENKNLTAKTKLISQKELTRSVFKEVRQSGSVSDKVYRKYFSLGGSKILLLSVVVVFVLGQISVSLKDKIISQWANVEDIIGKDNSTITQNEDLQQQRQHILYLYAAIIASLASMILLRGYLLFRLSRNISINLHKNMLKSVINAKMEFFNSTFLGNIINRFSKDLVTIDENLPFILHHVIAIIFETVGTLTLIATINTILLLPVTILFVILFLLRHGFLKTGRALKRLEATTKVPVVGNFNAVLTGLPTIRAFDAEELLNKEYEKNQDTHTSACYSNLSCMKAFVFAVDNCTSLFVAAVALKFVIFSENTAPGDVGLGISQAFTMSMITLFFGFQQWAELESKMTSVERALEYTNIQQETNNGIVLEKWPKSGKIEFKNVSLRLNSSKSYLLKNLNFVIEPGQKLGIVGRTGAGKSSILNVIFRLYDVEGNITIDDINIKTLSLQFLRTKISVLPQDPLLLQGTIRNNLDPEGKYSDEELWKVLEDVELRNVFPSLETEMLRKEINFGQKLLISLARILLSKNKILILDEIIESGDSNAEKLIYDIIDKHFASCTIIKITHKMKFVMDCDKVLVISKGQIVDYDSPQNLLRDENSTFYRMVEKSHLKKNN